MYGTLERPTNLVAVAEHPAAEVPVTVYVVASDSLQDTDAPVEALRPVDGDQLYVDAPEAESDTSAPPHTAAVAGVTDKVGIGLTVIGRVTKQPVDGTV